jgi:citrate synthase
LINIDQSTSEAQDCCMTTSPASTESTTLRVPPGLKGVEVTDTKIGDVRGLEGFYHYRQYSAVDLAEERTFEEVWQLLVDGSLPSSQAERAEFSAQVRSLRDLPRSLMPTLAAVAEASSGAGAFDSLRTGVSLLGASFQMKPLWDLDADTRRHDLLRLGAATPTLVAALTRLARGETPIDPDPTLGHTANYLWMLSGTRPDPRLARALEQYMILTIDHGFNASTFAARVITSTGADAAAAVVGGIGALSGPLHGGAPSRALDTLDAIGSADRADAFIRDAVGRGERIMGFGHAVYRTDDPRSVMLRGVARDLGGPLVELAIEVEQTVVRVLHELKPGYPLYANVEFYAGVVMNRCGLDRSLFTPTFAVSRVVGWSANINEQADDRHIIRPAAHYVGPPPPQPVPTLT